MLREDTVTYSSLPQEDGVTPSSHFITSRSGPNVHKQRDCKIATILTIAVVVSGLGLAATLPFILQGISQDTEVPDEALDKEPDDTVYSSYLNVGNKSSAPLEEGDPSESSNTGEKDSVSPVAIKKPTTDAVVIPATQPVLKPKPVLVTFQDVKSRTVADTAPPVGYFPLDPNEGNVETPGESGTPGEGSGKPAGEDVIPIGDGSSKTGTGGEASETEFSLTKLDGGKIPDVPGGGDNAAGAGGVPDNEDIGQLNGHGGSENVVTPIKPNTTMLPAEHAPASGNDDDMDKLLDEIYGQDESSKPSLLNNDSWLGSAVSSQDEVTLIVLAAVVAVALAAVLTALGWVVYSRVASRRRRLNIQSVITDLQSRDKIVLLNSESEEE